MRTHFIKVALDWHKKFSSAIKLCNNILHINLPFWDKSQNEDDIKKITIE